MMSALLALLLVPAVQSIPLDLTAVTLPPDSNVDLPLIPTGTVEVRTEPTVTRLRVRVDRTDVLAFGPTLPAFVVWAVSPEGEFRNLGELRIDGRRGELDATTPWQRLGVIITAEPHHLVDAPHSSVALKSGPPRTDKFRTETVNVQVGQYDYSTLATPAQGIPSRVAQARLALNIADQSGAGELAPSQLRTARVALDSMEELFRRDLSPELLLPYVNDAIRLADLATRTARREFARNQIEQVRRQGAELERELQRAGERVEALERQQQDAESRRVELLAEIQQVRDENRTYRLANDDLSRRLAAAENSVAALSDPWPPLRMGLARLGARETTRGMIVTVVGEQVRANQELTIDATRLLERLIGVLALTDTLDIRIEGHTHRPGSDTESLQMAEAVKSYLVNGGIPETSIRTEGLGMAQPIAGAAEAGQESLNRRVEIIFRAPVSR